MALLGVTASVLGVWSAPHGPGSARSSAESAALDVAALDVHRSAVLDLSTVRQEVPRGYGTVAARAAQAAAEQAAAAAAQAAAAQAAAASASARARPTTGRSVPPPSATPTPRGLPLGVDPGSSTQVVTVVAASSRATTAKLTVWGLGPDGWTPVQGPVTAWVGKDGVGRASETSSRTPAGTFPLTEGFGRQADPGTAVPYRLVDAQDWWVSDATSPHYNQHARCAPGTCPFDEARGENLLAAGAVYDYALVIGYNRSGTPGAGSAFFLHVTNGSPTVGCVAIDRAALVTLMRWLDPAAHPLVAIGVE